MPKTLKLSNSNNLPIHIGIIVDGNRRWAKKHHLPSMAGHKYVTDKILEPIIYRCLELKIPYITFWAFSTENWKRGEKFSQALFNLLRQGLKRNIKKYDRAGMRLNTIGDLSKLPQDLVRVIKDWEEKSQKNQKITVTIALNYGGRDEIVRAISKLTQTLKPACRRGRLSNSQTLKKISEKKFSSYLDTANLPDPDLIIRTGGARRLSGFLPWQAVYAELYFTDVFMPDFTVKEFNKALEEFSNRQRRYGE